MDVQALCARTARWLALATASASMAGVAAEEAPVLWPGLVQGEVWARHAIDDSSMGADGVRLADVNGDGRLDIATGWEEGGVVRIYTQPDPGSVREPWPRVTVGAVGSPEDAVLVDVDGDGAGDVVSATEGTERRLFIHWSPSDPALRPDASAWQTAALPASAGRQWMFTVPVQLDGANGPDLVVGGKNEGAELGWFRSPANARSVADWTWHPLRPVGWVMSIVVKDMDRDWDLDIVYGDRKGPRRGIGWLENPGGDHLLGDWPDHAMGGHDREVMFMAEGDVDGRGRLEWYAATRGGGLLRLARTPGSDGWKQTEIPLPTEVGTGKAVAIGDVDKDGRGDLVVSCEAAEGKHGVFYLSRSEEADWRPYAVSGLEGTKFDRIELLDLDGDGDLDVLTCEERENLGVIWYENPGSGSGLQG